MKNFLIAATLCALTAGARAETFEQQVLQFSRQAVFTARQAKEGFSLRRAAALAPAQAAWHKVTGVDNSFTCEMPGVPKYTELPKQGYSEHEYRLAAAGGLFTINTAIYPSNYSLTSMQANLDRWAKELDLVGGKWTSVAWVKHEGFPGVDAIGSAIDEFGDISDVRYYFVTPPSRIVFLAYEGPDGSARSADVERFVRSLRIR